ncbi:HNH endonuclease [Paracoccus sp. (in: a-proteobacteria)]|uniref:HNH endonuclease n=1 Tax=Paracoccus sp. TaxID=267 RepID=UPI002AFE76D3|nr:HNH endonuclease [Paracoccus sp. (in: a-proteobacteria)]
MAKKPLPSPEVLRQLLRYEPETGKLFWRERSESMFEDGAHRAALVCARWNTRYAGKAAFDTRNHNGYKLGGISNRNILAHRVIWAIVHGRWPVADIDHINGNRQDNRLCNLREVSRSTNLRNARLPDANTSGRVGVSWDRSRGKWLAYIHANGRMVNLGRFDAFEEAVSARKAEEARWGYHPNHGRL